MDVRGQECFCCCYKCVVNMECTSARQKKFKKIKYNN